MRAVFLFSSVVALVSFSLGFAQAQNKASNATTEQVQKCAHKTVVSAGKDMGTFIEAAQANFGKSCVAVAWPNTQVK